VNRLGSAALAVDRASALSGLAPAAIIDAIRETRVFGRRLPGGWFVSALALPLLAEEARRLRGERPTITLRIARALPGSSSHSFQGGDTMHTSSRQIEAQARGAPQQAFREIADNEIPPAVDWDFVATRPALQALLARAPEEAKPAVFYLYRKGEEETKAKVRLHIDQLRALATQGDEGAAGILAVRVESLRMQQWTPRARALAASAGLSEADLVRYSPDFDFSKMGQR